MCKSEMFREEMKYVRELGEGNTSSFSLLYAEVVGKYLASRAKNKNVKHEKNHIAIMKSRKKEANRENVRSFDFRSIARAHL